MGDVLPPTDRNDTLHARARHFFWLGSAAEAGLGLLAVWLLELEGRSWLSLAHLDARAVWLGLVAALPLFLFFQQSMRVRGGPLAPIRRFLEQSLRPMLVGWRWWHLLVLSVLAGIGEELFFRGVVQGWLGQRLGDGPALLIAGAIFGVAHRINLAYAVVAALMGVGLGGLWLVSGSLVCPMITHALYDFLALLWLMRGGRTTAGPGTPAGDTPAAAPDPPGHFGC